MVTIEPTLVSNSALLQALPPVQNLLSIGPDVEDHDDLHRIITDVNWRITTAETLYDALNTLTLERFAVIFCEETLEDGSWTDLLHQPGEAPVVVTSRLADARLWGEVLNVGGYDVLAKPYRSREVLHLLRTITLRLPVAAAHAKGAAGM